MNREDSALEGAAKRLENALGLLEHRLARTPPAGDSRLLDEERARLYSELTQARAREKELEAAGAEASAALGRAIAEIQATLAGEA
jgi:hypothetical protein